MASNLSENLSLAPASKLFAESLATRFRKRDHARFNFQASLKNSCHKYFNSFSPLLSLSLE